MEDRSTQKDTDMGFARLSPDSQLENATGSYTPVLQTCNEFATPVLFSSSVYMYMTVNPSYTEIWGNMLFWAFLMTTLVYVVVGVACAVCLRVTKKGVSFIIPFLFLGCGELKVLCGDAIACESLNVCVMFNGVVNSPPFLFLWTVLHVSR